MPPCFRSTRHSQACCASGQIGRLFIRTKLLCCLNGLTGASDASRQRREVVMGETVTRITSPVTPSQGGNGSSEPATPAVRRRLPNERHSLTHHFSVGGQEGYVTVGLYEDGLTGELFIRMAKEGSTVSGLMDSFATAVSLALQYGVPLRVLCDKFSHTRFEPSGWTGNPKIGYAKSLTDYLFRWLELRSLKGEQGILFELPRPAQPQREVTSVVEGLGQVVELGDA